MNLKEFVKNAIVEIVEAVEKSSDASKRKIVLRHPSGDNLRTIEFDVAVSVEKEGVAEGGGGIKVLSFVEAKGGLKRSTKSSTVSRIVFGVNVSNRTKAEEVQYEAEQRQRINNTRQAPYEYQ